jgi:type II secretory pathway component PulF
MFNSSTFKYIFSNIALYTSLGFPVTDSVELLQKRARISKKYTNLLHRVINLLNEGKSITESFAEMIHMKKYGKILSVLLHTQEQAGSVALGFKSIEECVDKIEHSKQTIIQNFAYPILVLCFACAMIFFIGNIHFSKNNLTIYRPACTDSHIHTITFEIFRICNT